MSPVDPTLRIVSLPSMDELNSYIHKTLCELDRLDLAMTPLRTVPLTRNTRTCGLIYHVDGPRKLRTSAVWAADEQRILVYNSTGERVIHIRLSESPELAEAQAA